MRLLREFKRLLAPEGTFILSVWQFINSPRLVGRIQSWERPDWLNGDVDEGDVLLDWRAEGESAGAALRYVHAFSEDGNAATGWKSGFQITGKLAHRTERKAIWVFTRSGRGLDIGVHATISPILTV